MGRRTHLSPGRCVPLLAVALIVGAALLGLPVASAEELTLTHFDGDLENVTLAFRDSTWNGSASIVLPLGCTVTEAQLDIEGVRQRGDDVRTLDFSAYDPGTTPHRAWRGWVQGNYPPSYPAWDPYTPRGTAFNTSNYDDVGASDDDRARQGSTNQMTDRYPFHMFRFLVPDGTLTGLSVHWEGFGYCLANSTQRGAELFVWRNASRTWTRVDWYSKTEALQDRVLGRAWREDATRYVDDDDQVFVLVLGKRSQNVAGPNPWTAEGEVQTDYVFVNATYEGDWEYVEDVELSLGDSGPVWTRSGILTSRATVGAAEGLADALQSEVDGAPVEPGNLTVQLGVNVSRATAGVVRLSRLSVTYEPIVNLPPSWGTPPVLKMEEDVDATRVLDLATVAYDDHSHADLEYSIVEVSTTAVEAVIEEGRYLSLHPRLTDWHGTFDLLVEAEDPWGLTTTSPRISVEVMEVNDPPLVSSPGRQRATQDEPFEYVVEASDVDGDELAYSIVGGSFPIDAATGEINFTPTNDQVGFHRVNISVSDGRGGVTWVRMELDVRNVNDPPSIVDPGRLLSRQGLDFNHTFAVEDIDLIHGDQMTWEILGPDFYVSNLLLNPLGGTLEWRNIGNEDVGDHVFTIQVQDSGGARDTLDVELLIENVNDAPRFAHIMDQTVFEDGHLSYSIRVTDPDMAVDPEEVLTWTVDPPLFEILPGGSFTFVPHREELGDHNVTIRVVDRLGASYQQTFKLRVKHVNHPPVLEAIPDQIVIEDEPWTLDIRVSDPDPGDTVEVVSRGAPFNVPSAGGLVRWTPEQRHGGEHLVTLEATDPTGAKTVLAFNLTVIIRNDPPVVTIQEPEEGAFFKYGEALYLKAQVFDEEGEAMAVVWRWRYSDDADQQWTRINTGSTVFWPKPPDGPILLQVEVSDGSNVSTAEVTFEVGAPPREEDGGSLTAILAIALVVLVAVLILFYIKGRRSLAEAGPPEEPGDGEGTDAEEEGTSEEGSWEPY